MKIEIADSKFTVKATPGRVWELLPFAIFNGVEGMEKIDIVNERFFRAVMPLKLAFVRLNTHLSGEIFDIRESEALAVALKAKVVGGIIQVNQKIIFTLTSKGANETEVRCEILAEGSSPIFKILVKKARAISGAIVDNIEKVIKRLA